MFSEAPKNWLTLLFFRPSMVGIALIMVKAVSAYITSRMRNCSWPFSFPFSGTVQRFKSWAGECVSTPVPLLVSAVSGWRFTSGYPFHFKPHGCHTLSFANILDVFQEMETGIPITNENFQTLWENAIRYTTSRALSTPQGYAGARVCRRCKRIMTISEGNLNDGNARRSTADTSPGCGTA